MTMSYVRNYYGVPAYRGGLVTIDGRQGRILSANESIFVRFNDDGSRVPMHPTWRVTYHECHNAVEDRDGYEEPCNRPAIGYRYDTEFISEGPYPVCRRHFEPPFTEAEALAEIEEIEALPVVVRQSRTAGDNVINIRDISTWEVTT